MCDVTLYSTKVSVQQKPPKRLNKKLFRNYNFQEKRLKYISHIESSFMPNFLSHFWVFSNFINIDKCVFQIHQILWRTYKHTINRFSSANRFKLVWTRIKWMILLILSLFYRLRLVSIPLSHNLWLRTNGVIGVLVA